MSSQIFKKLVFELSKLPSVGEKSATRFAFFIINQSEDYAKELANAILDAKKYIKECKICGAISEEDICEICSDYNRNQNIVCIVEENKDIKLIENTKKFDGLYHVLGGTINPLSGKSPDKLNIKNLLIRIEKNKNTEKEIKEVIIALNTNVEGTITSQYLKQLLEPLEIKVTKLASGIPLGSNIEFADLSTLGQAIKERTEI